MTHITPAAAAWYYSIPVGTIYYWANKDHWAKHGTRGHREYEFDEVQTSYVKRRAADRLDSLTSNQGH